MRRRPLEVVEAVVAGLAWAALVVGLSVSTLTVPAFTLTLERALGIPETAGLPREDVDALSARVRDFVAAQDPPVLPVVWSGQPAFDERAVSHLRDVRAVIMGGRVATGLVAGALAAFLGICVARKRRRPLADSMRIGAWTLVGLLAVGVVLAFGDWETMFAGFHGLFFKSGTWTFAYDSLLIRLFPERFWVTAAASLGALCGIGAVVLGLAARYVGAARSEVGSIRTAEDV